jgi:hypothetical protein
VTSATFTVFTRCQQHLLAIGIVGVHLVTAVECRFPLAVVIIGSSRDDSRGAGQLGGLHPQCVHLLGGVHLACIRPGVMKRVGLVNGAFI